MCSLFSPKAILKWIFLTFIFTSIYRCDTKTSSIPEANLVNKSVAQTIQSKLIATGGTPADFAVCPKSPYDTIVKIGSLNPVAKESEPEMTVEGIERFIRENGITKMEQLLNRFPEHYRNNFSLVEITRATGQSNLEFPRIVLFGSDGRFLLNIGTKADDPAYHLLDVMELHDDSGRWEMSVFDFSGPTPKLTRNDPSCIECHGDKNARPVWGTNLMWDGAFGDHVSPRPQGEALDTKHAVRMNEIIDGQGRSPRFDFLQWHEERPRRGGKRKIANHVVGIDLFMSNIAMGSATSRGSYIRLKQKYPEKYKSLREEILFAYYLKKGNAYITDQQRPVIEAITTQLNMAQFDLDSLLTALGMNPNEAFSLATLFETENPDTNWSMGRGTLYDMLMLQILDDLMKDTPLVQEILTSRSLPEAIFGCPDTAKSIADVVDYKMLHLFYLRGAAKYEVHKTFYPLDVEDIYDRVFIPISHHFLAFLRENISSEIETPKSPLISAN